MSSDTCDVCVVLGTRPELIKLAPVVRSLVKVGVRTRVVATGQHGDLVREMAPALEIQLDSDLDVMRDRQSLNGLTARVFERLGRELAARRPRAVVVQGDTTTAVCAALAAFNERIPVAHVEAGLRTHNNADPFPEEMNRRLISRLATWHFAPTREAAHNLMAEGVASEMVDITGNTGIDTLLWVVDQGLGSSGFHNAPSGARKVLVTLHRRESHGLIMSNIAKAVRRLAQNHNLQVVLPLHPNPEVNVVVVRAIGQEPRVRLVPPLGYFDFIATLADCDFVMTDSGGVQEEAPALGKPVLILRNSTERPEAVKLGVSVLVGVDLVTVEREAARLCTDSARYMQMSRPVFPFGDGSAASRIAARLFHDLQVEPGDGSAEAERSRVIDLTDSAQPSLFENRHP